MIDFMGRDRLSPAVKVYVGEKESITGYQGVRHLLDRQIAGCHPRSAQLLRVTFAD
jgi:hypothetical protein